jgi:peptidoglycan hydrolase CwlO-like protein
MWKWTKRMLIVGAVCGGAGALCFGTNLLSYVESSSRMLKNTVQDSIPIEFEIQRARDHLEKLLPEMHANLRLVASQEVEVANLQKDIDAERAAIEREKNKVRKLRQALHVERTNYVFSGRDYRRKEVVDELARRFEHLQSAEKLSEGKSGLLRNRRHTLNAAVKKLERTRLERIDLAAQIEALEGQFHLVQAQSGSCDFRLDDTALAKTEKVISELKNRLEIAQRVLAREARFVELIPLEAVSEDHVIDRIDDYLNGVTVDESKNAVATNDASF